MMIHRHSPLLFVAVLLGSVGTTLAQAPNWQVDFTAFEHSHNVTAAVLVGDARLSGSDHQLAAFVNGEVRGVAESTPVSGAWLFFISVYGNASGEHVTFRAYDASSDTVYEIEQALDFSVNGISGSPSTPFWLETAGVVTSAQREHPASSMSLGRNYPNPFVDATEIPFRLDAPSDVRLEIFDLLGRSVSVLIDRALASGSHTARLDAASLPAGIYSYRLTAGGAQESRVMVLLR